MFCSKCGNELNEGAAFCPKCGRAVNSVDERLKDNDAKDIISDIKASNSVKIIKIIGIVIAGIIGIPGIMAFTSSFKGNHFSFNIFIGGVALLLDACLLIYSFHVNKQIYQYIALVLSVVALLVFASFIDIMLILLTSVVAFLASLYWKKIS